MVPQFFRIYRPSEDKEMLFNVNHISKIEVEYAVPGDTGQLWSTSLRVGQESPNAVRVYRVHVGGEVLLLPADPDDPVKKIFDEIYKQAIKG